MGGLVKHDEARELFMLFLARSENNRHPLAKAQLPGNNTTGEHRFLTETAIKDMRLYKTTAIKSIISYCFLITLERVQRFSKHVASPRC